MPKLDPTVFLAEGAKVIGDVELAAGVSIWFNAVVRGDVMPIKIGKQSNIQDQTVVHGTLNKAQTTIGERVSVGHSCVLHGTRVDDETLVGMGCILMDHSHIARNCIVGAGSLVTQGFTCPEGVLVMGRPAKVIRDLNLEEIQFLSQSADNYLKYQTWYQPSQE